MNLNQMRNLPRQAGANHLRLSKGLLQSLNEHRVSVSLPLQLTVSDGEWLGRTLSATLGRVRAQVDTVVVKDVTLRYRPGRLGVADAMDAAAQVLAPLSAAGASVEPRDDWYLADEDEEEDDGEAVASKAQAWHKQYPDEDLILRARVDFNAPAEDVGAAILYWVLRSLGNA